MGIKIVAAVSVAAVVLAIGGYAVADAIVTQRIKAAIDQNLAKLPAGVNARYQDFSYSLWQRKATLTGLSASVSNADTSVSETADQIDILDASASLPTALAQFQENPSAVSTDDVIPIADEVDLNGVSVRSRNVTATLDHASLKGLRLHPWPLFQKGVPTAADAAHTLMALQTLLASQSRDPAFLAARLQALTPPLRLAAAALLALDVDAFDEGHLSEHVHTPARPSVPAFDTTISCGVTVHSQGLHQGIQGPSESDDCEAAVAGKFTFKFARTNNDGINFRAAATQLIGGAALSPELLDAVKFGALTINDIAIQSPATGTITVADFGVDSVAFDQGLPVAGHLSVDGVHVTQAQLTRSPASIRLMRLLDLPAATLSLDIGYRWDLPQQSLTLDRTKIKIDELGTLDIDGAVGGVTPNSAADQLQNQVVLDQARLRFTDASLINRAFKGMAADRGTDPLDMRQGIISAIQQRGPMLGDTPAATGIVSAVTTFLETPTALTLTAAPTTPVPLNELHTLATASPAAIVQTLGLSAVADPALNPKP